MVREPPFFDRHLMRILQFILFVVGATSAAAVLGAVIAFLLSLSVLPTGPDAWGSGHVFLLLAVAAAIVAGLAGFVASLYRIANHPPKPWNVGHWLGAMTGWSVAMIIRISGVFEDSMTGYAIEWLPGMLLLLGALAFLGGLTGGKTMELVQGK